MIPDGAKNVKLVFSEDYSDVMRLKVGVEVKGKYGKMRVPHEYIGECLVVLIPKEVAQKIQKRNKK